MCSKRLRAGITGFTLIELLVVIAIIATLAAILFPVFTSAKDSSKRTKCMSNIKQIYSGWNMYIQDWGGRVPKSLKDGVVGWGEWRSQGNADMMGWTEKIHAYTRNIKIYGCPTSKLNYTYALNSRLGTKPSTSIEPAVPGKTICIFEVPSYDERNPAYGRGTISVSGENDALKTGDSDLTNDGQEDQWCYGESYRYKDGHPIEDEAVAPVSSYKKNFSWLYFPGRHGGGNNICFTDGHVQWFSDWENGRMTFDPAKDPIKGKPAALQRSNGLL